MDSVSSARFLGPPFCPHQSTLQHAGQAWSEGNSLPAPESKSHSCHFPGQSRACWDLAPAWAEARPIGLASSWGSGNMRDPGAPSCHLRGAQDPLGEGPWPRSLPGGQFSGFSGGCCLSSDGAEGKGDQEGRGARAVPSRWGLPVVGPICREACFTGMDWPDPRGGAWGQGDWPTSCALGRRHLCGLETQVAYGYILGP